MFANLSENTKSFWVGSSQLVDVIEDPSIQDMQRAVQFFRPAIFKGMLNTWPAMNWTLDGLATKISNCEINFTPTGRADAVQYAPETDQEYFLYPAAVDLPFRTFQSMLEHPTEDDAVPYLSQQDDNLRRQFPTLLSEVGASIPLAEAVFGAEALEAVNLWIGDERSVTSLHKDFYENMYAVIEGEKTFWLFPPSDVAFLDEREYPTRQYSVDKARTEDGAHIKIHDMFLLPTPPNSSSVPWIALDPCDPTIIDKVPKFKYASPLYCTLKKGEVLYIPAMWYHRVSQTCVTIAVNYWFDMKFDFRFVFYEAIRNSLTSEQLTAQGRARDDEEVLAAIER